VKSLIVAFCLLLVAFPAAAAFVPCRAYSGLSIQQWYGVCGGALQENYREGYGHGMSWDDYVQSMYRIYAGPAPGPAGGDVPNAGMLCNPGAAQCFNHWVRTCQRMATGGSWWITSSQQCN
jgi:hypothetical protein